MILFSVSTICLITLIGFVAGFLDAIVGGGGLIATPALMSVFPSFQILQIIATNRASSIAGTSVAAWNYLRTIDVNKKALLSAAITASCMALIGVQMATLIPPIILKIIILIVIGLLAVYTFLKKDFGQEENIQYDDEKLPYITAAIGAACGFYNGLIGPGTGTILVFAFVSVVGMNFLKSSAISKITNVAGDIGSWSLLLMKGYVFWQAAIPLILGNMLGSYVGSQTAILKGSKFIRIIFLLVVSALIVKVLYDLAK